MSSPNLSKGLFPPRLPQETFKAMPSGRKKLPLTLRWLVTTQVMDEVKTTGRSLKRKQKDRVPRVAETSKRRRIDPEATPLSHDFDITDHFTLIVVD